MFVGDHLIQDTIVPNLKYIILLIPTHASLRKLAIVQHEVLGEGPQEPLATWSGAWVARTCSQKKFRRRAWPSVFRRKHYTDFPTFFSTDISYNSSPECVQIPECSFETFVCHTSKVAPDWRNECSFHSRRSTIWDSHSGWWWFSFSSAVCSFGCRGCWKCKSSMEHWRRGWVLRKVLSYYTLVFNDVGSYFFLPWRCLFNLGTYLSQSNPDRTVRRLGFPAAGGHILTGLHSLFLGLMWASPLKNN